MRIKSKKAQDAVNSRITAIVIVIALVIVTFIFLYNVDINKYLRYLPGYNVPEEDEEIITGDEGAKIQILQDYDNGKCLLNDNTCQIESASCYCFSKFAYADLINTEFLGEKNCNRGSFCYDKSSGCSPVASTTDFYNKNYMAECKKTNPNFKQLALCSIDFSLGYGKVNGLCTCPSKEELINIKFPFNLFGRSTKSDYEYISSILNDKTTQGFSLCDKDNYCFFNSYGCVNEARFQEIKSII